MKKTNTIARHGDILLKKTSKIVGEKSQTKTLAFGEITGHHHSFGANDNVVCFAEDGEVKSVQVLSDSVIDHQEHGKIKIEEGIYTIYRKTEYDPFREVLRRVRD